ncbi:MAG: phosphatidate cytidylyltransferase [Parvibaculaceae bacterium]|nr:phosphatidate cytidylyltransferase [Parvibaculaceae bacterium]
MAEKALSSLTIRIMSALVLAPVVLGLVWVGGLPFLVLMGLAAALIAYELKTLLLGGQRSDMFLLGCAGVLVVAIAGVGAPEAGLVMGLGGCLSGIAWRIWRRQPLLPVILAHVYLAVPLVALIWFRMDPSYGLAAVLWLLAVVWATDIFAYAAGRTIGGPKLAPSISPGKTWAGLAGGMAGALVVGLATGFVLGGGPGFILPLLSVMLAVAAQAGDLFESALKRRAGVKDSSRLIPGHGGILDRVDGLVAAASIAALVALLHGGPTPGAGVLIWP